MSGNTGLRKDLSPKEFQMFRDWIHQHSGIYLEESKTDSLRISLVTRATRLDYTDYEAYFRFLAGDEDEFKELMNLVTINETSFFRFPAQFDALRDKIIPQLVDQRPKDATRRFRVWSAGCSTGEEPYTIAMTLLDSALEGLGYTCETHGTDVSTQALDHARRAIYPDRAMANLSQNTIQRYFDAVPEGHRPKQRVRKLCTFHYHNLIKEPYPLAFMSNWDVIFCRNVTIYFRIESTKRVVDNFYDALNPGGYLFIGHSETLTSVSDRFEPVEIDGVFLYRKPQEKRGFTFQDVVAKRRAETRSADRKRLVRKDRDTVPAPRLSTASNAEPLTKDERTGAVDQIRLLLEQADPQAALKLAERVLATDPSDLDGHILAASALADIGDLAGAMAQAEEALRMNPLAAPARYITGVIRQQQGSLEAALQDFKKTLYIDRDFVMAHFASANIHRQQGRNKDACRAYENTLHAIYSNPDGAWKAFMGGFRTDLLVKICERSLLECGKGAQGPNKGSSNKR